MINKIFFVGYNLENNSLSSRSMVSGEIKNANYLYHALEGLGLSVEAVSINLYPRASLQKPDLCIEKSDAKGVFRWLKEGLKLRRILKDKSTHNDILYLTVPSYLPFLAGLPFYKKVITAHGTYWPELLADVRYEKFGFRKVALLGNGIIQLFIDRIAFKFADKLHSVSEFQVKEMVSDYSISREKISVVRNGTDFVNQSVEREYDAIWIGRIAKKKNIKFFLDYIEENPSGKYCIVAGNEYFSIDIESEKRLHEIKRSKPLDIELLQDITDSQLELLLSKSKCLVVTSTGYESIPTVIFEGLACGTPVVCPASWGVGEVEGCGLITYEEGNYSDMVESIELSKGSTDIYVDDVVRWSNRARLFKEELL